MVYSIEAKLRNRIGTYTRPIQRCKWIWVTFWVKTNINVDNEKLHDVCLTVLLPFRLQKRKLTWRTKVKTRGYNTTSLYKFTRDLCEVVRHFALQLFTLIVERPWWRWRVSRLRDALLCTWARNLCCSYSGGPLSCRARLLWCIQRILLVPVLMASGINIYSFFFRYPKNYSGYPKKNLWYLKYWHINFRYLKKNSRYQK